MINNIVFDMGQVIIRFEPRTFIERYTISEEDKNLLEKEVFHSVEWIGMDHGVVTADEAVESVCKRIPDHLQTIASDLIHRWFEPLLLVDGMDEIIRGLKRKGYRIWLLSNAAENQPGYWAKVPVSECFDGTLISYEVRLLKPDPAIYRCFTKKFDLKPDECLFIDDNPMNVEGAVYCGWKGIVFHGDTGELIRKMAELGIECFI